MKQDMLEKIILDTDIGPDCDDTGAMALLHELANNKEAEILAVTHCTSNPFGSGCVDAINRWYGRGDIPIGTLECEGFLNEDEHKKYNKYIAENYPNRYPQGEGVPSAVKVLRETLIRQEDGSVVVVAIGPLPNMLNLLESKPDDISPLYGYELVKRKVKRLVVMGGGLNNPEYNFIMHPQSTVKVCANWPTEIWFSTFEAGADIMTGVNWGHMPEEHPVRKSYALYAPDGRMSWDLTAVWAAVMGVEPYYELSEPGIMVGLQDGANNWVADAKGQHRYMILKASEEQVGKDFDAIMRGEGIPK